MSEGNCWRSRQESRQQLSREGATAGSSLEEGAQGTCVSGEEQHHSRKVSTSLFCTNRAEGNKYRRKQICDLRISPVLQSTNECPIIPTPTPLLSSSTATFIQLPQRDLRPHPHKTSLLNLSILEQLLTISHTLLMRAVLALRALVRTLPFVIGAAFDLSAIAQLISIIQILPASTEIALKWIR